MQKVSNWESNQSINFSICRHYGKLPNFEHVYLENE